MLVAAALLDEHDLVDAGLLVGGEMLGELGRGADAAALADRRQLVPGRLEALPDIRNARLVMAVDVIVPERVAEELETLGAAPARFVAILVTGEAGHHGDVGIHRMADRHALGALDDLVILVRPLAGLGGIDEGKGERADARPRRGMDGLAPAARHPDRRMRLLQRPLGTL